MVLTERASPEQIAALRARAKRAVGRDVDRVGTISNNCCEVRTKANGNRLEVRCVATTDRIDSVKEVVLPGGIDWAPLRLHKRIFADHWYGMGDVVGTFRAIDLFPDKMNPKGWRVSFDLMPDDYSETVRQARIMAEQSAIAMSIGFIPLEWGAPTGDEAKRYPGAEIITRKAIGFEISVVTMPCNLDAIGGGIVADTSKAAVYRGMVAKGLISGRGFTLPREPETIMVCV